MYRIRQESIHVFRKRHAAICGGGSDSGDLLMAKYINPRIQEHKVLVGGLVFVNTYTYEMMYLYAFGTTTLLIARVF